MVDSISSKDMSKLRRILVRNLSGGSSTEVSTSAPPTQTEIPFYKKTFFKVLVGVLIFVIFGGLITFGIMSLINNQETTQTTQTTTVATENTPRNPDNDRETITIGVSDSETTRSSGNRRSSNTQRTENIESTQTVDSRSCVNGVCD